jgi:hypothetical protein
MNPRNTIPVFLGALLGFLLGAMFMHLTSVKAQSGLPVYVQSNYASIMTLGPTSVPGTQIVAFSCRSDKDGDFQECLTAYVK